MKIEVVLNMGEIEIHANGCDCGRNYVYIINKILKNNTIVFDHDFWMNMIYYLEKGKVKIPIKTNKLSKVFKSKTPEQAKERLIKFIDYVKERELKFEEMRDKLTKKDFRCGVEL